MINFIFGLLQKHELHISIYTTEENVSLFPETIDFLREEWVLLSLFPLYDRVLMGPVLCRSSQLLWLEECDNHGMPGRQSSMTLLSPLALTFSVLPPLQYSQSLWWGDTGALFMAEYSTVSYHQHFDELWISGVPDVYRKRNILWSKLTATPICRDECNLFRRYIDGHLLSI